MSLKKPYRRKKITDGRTPAARKSNLTGAAFDMAGNMISGRHENTGVEYVNPAARRAIYRTTPTAPEQTGTPASETGAGRIRRADTPDTRTEQVAFSPTQFRKPTLAPMMGDALGDSSKAQAATAAMRTAQSVRDGAAVGAAVSAEQKRQRLATYGRGPATITDPTRPAAQRPSGFARIERAPTARDGQSIATVTGKYGSGEATRGPSVAGDVARAREMSAAGVAAADKMGQSIAPRFNPPTPTDRREVKTQQDASAAGVAAVDKMDRAMDLPDLQKQGPKLDLAAADPLKRKRAAMKTY